MSFKFNPFTGTLDITGPGGGSTFDPDTILTDEQGRVLVDQNGNVLVGA